MSNEHAPATAWHQNNTTHWLPPLMLESDPRLSCRQLAAHLPPIIVDKNQCPVSRDGNMLTYRECRNRELTFTLLAGDVTLPITSRVGVIDDFSSLWYLKGIVTEVGIPLDVTAIAPAEKVSTARQMITLVTRLHEKGIIHGDIRVENFIRRPQDDRLRLVGLTSARMADDSDLNSWPAELPTPEYASPKRGQGLGPSSVFDDYFALAICVWAVFSGEKPVAGLFSSNEGRAPDVPKITDDELMCHVLDILEEGGLALESIHTLPRRDTTGLVRAHAFPLVLFDADFDSPSGSEADTPRPSSCPHCPKKAVAYVHQDGKMPLNHPTEYPEYCNLGVLKFDVSSVSDYALEWLLSQESVAPADDAHSGMTPWSQYLSSPKLRPILRLDTKFHRVQVQGLAQSPGSGTTSAGATVVAAGRVSGGKNYPRSVSKAPEPAPSESDEGYQSMSRRSSSTASDTRPRSYATSLSRPTSAGSESSFGSWVEADRLNKFGTRDSKLGSESPLRTPKANRLHASFSREGDA